MTFIIPVIYSDRQPPKILMVKDFLPYPPPPNLSLISFNFMSLTFHVQRMHVYCHLNYYATYMYTS